MKKRKKQITEFPWPLIPGQTQSIVTDPQGSYTGIAENALEIPVQDVDDL